MPQSKQTMTSGNIHTVGLSIFSSPRKWMPISALNSNQPHDLQGIPARHSFRTRLCMERISLWEGYNP